MKITPKVINKLRYPTDEEKKSFVTGIVDVRGSGTLTNKNHYLYKHLIGPPKNFPKLANGTSFVIYSSTDVRTLCKFTPNNFLLLGIRIYEMTGNGAIKEIIVNTVEGKEIKIFDTSEDLFLKERQNFKSPIVFEPEIDFVPTEISGIRFHFKSDQPSSLMIEAIEIVYQDNFIRIDTSIGQSKLVDELTKDFGRINEAFQKSIYEEENKLKLDYEKNIFDTIVLAKDVANGELKPLIFAFSSIVKCRSDFWNTFLCMKMKMNVSNKYSIDQFQKQIKYGDKFVNFIYSQYLTTCSMDEDVLLNVKGISLRGYSKKKNESFDSNKSFTDLITQILKYNCKYAIWIEGVSFQKLNYIPPENVKNSDEEKEEDKKTEEKEEEKKIEEKHEESEKVNDQNENKNKEDKNDKEDENKLCEESVEELKESKVEMDPMNQFFFNPFLQMLLFYQNQNCFKSLFSSEELPFIYQFKVFWILYWLCELIEDNECGTYIFYRMLNLVIKGSHLNEESLVYKQLDSILSSIIHSKDDLATMAELVKTTVKLIHH
ncbi:hypothetical protein SNEBB_010933 [Seison nebaliae]|nr:hypothetical protein SNEBB_010933 [Seison nebaliae]